MNEGVPTGTSFIMFKMILTFLLVWVFFFFSIGMFRSASGQEKYLILKSLMYGLLCAILTMGFIVAIVILF